MRPSVVQSEIPVRMSRGLIDVVPHETRRVSPRWQGPSTHKLHAPTCKRINLTYPLNRSCTRAT